MEPFESETRTPEEVATLLADNILIERDEIMCHAGSSPTTFSGRQGIYLVNTKTLADVTDLRVDAYGAWGSSVYRGAIYYAIVDGATVAQIKQTRQELIGKKAPEKYAFVVKFNRYRNASSGGHLKKTLYQVADSKGAAVGSLAAVQFEWDTEPFDFDLKSDGKFKRHAPNQDIMSRGCCATNEPIKCVECGQECESLDRFRSHFCSLHLKYAPFYCSYCEYRFPGELELRLHHQWYHREMCLLLNYGLIADKEARLVDALNRILNESTSSALPHNPDNWSEEITANTTTQTNAETSSGGNAADIGFYDAGLAESSSRSDRLCSMPADTVSRYRSEGNAIGVCKREQSDDSDTPQISPPPIIMSQKLKPPPVKVAKIGYSTRESKGPASSLRLAKRVVRSTSAPFPKSKPTLLLDKCDDGLSVIRFANHTHRGYLCIPDTVLEKAKTDADKVYLEATRAPHSQAAQRFVSRNALAKTITAFIAVVVGHFEEGIPPPIEYETKILCVHQDARDWWDCVKGQPEPICSAYRRALKYLRDRVDKETTKDQMMEAVKLALYGSFKRNAIQRFKQQRPLRISINSLPKL